MPRKPVVFDLDYAIREYRAGTSGVQIARDLGVSNFGLVYQRLREAGVVIGCHRPPVVLARRVAFPVEEAAARYRDGWSVNQLATHFGVSRTVVDHRLREHGVEVRNQSASERLKWAAMTPTQRARQVAPAHAATRLVPVTMARKVKHAQTVQAKRLHISSAERRLAALLTARGLVTIPQQAIGPYNCDLGAAPVAVEVYGGHWHWHGRHLLRTPDRFRYLLNAGWHVLVLLVTKAVPLAEASADYVAAYVQAARGQPTAIREYRVIRGAGEVLAAGRADDEEISIVPAITAGRDAATGQYKAVPR